MENIKQNSCLKNSWEGKNVLFIGDSLTEMHQYPLTVQEKLGINIFYHCKCGGTILQMVDGLKGLDGDYSDETDELSCFKPLTADDVAGKDLIIFFSGYNSRYLPAGNVGDCYNPADESNNSIAGNMQYCINRIYEELKKAGNMECRLLTVTVDCFGKYPWIDADGYEEWPKGSGMNSEKIANMQKAVSEANGIPCCDLWHNSGINRNTWHIFGYDVSTVNENFSPYLLDSEGNPVSDEKITYEKGKYYYQKRDGKVVYELYNSISPLPYIGDQLHKSEAGYKRIGECITGAIIRAYGN